MKRDFEIIVIGSGPGGEGAAMTLAKRGKRVALVEKDLQVGGSSTFRGTIPSKILRHTVQMMQDFKEHPLFAPIMGQTHISLAQMLNNTQTIVNGQSQVRRGFYDRNKVAVRQGFARFINDHEIEISKADGSCERLTADAFIIATGSRPYRPPDIDFQHPRILDSDTLLETQLSPKTASIYGAGVIGCEYASILSGLNIKINLINTRENLLAFLDNEIADALGYHLRHQSVLIRNNEEYSRVEPQNDGVIIYLKSGKVIKTDVLLWANGRTGNTDEMGLESIGLQVNHRGQIHTNERYQTTHAHIYAVGDVTGAPGLSSASYDQGRFAAIHFAEGVCESKLIEDIPTGIYTNPEISLVGKTEKELTDEQVPYEVGRAMFNKLARSQIAGCTVGMLKILFHRETLAILGIHCFGHQAAEIIHIGQAIMSQQNGGNSLRYFVDTTFNYPTMAEAYRVAALDGLNRIF